ncbi:nucleotidyltransferase domain-containing protein [Acidovorax sp. K2F]|uniref:nucleotidyltransferase domain-containing protein n=1 Tax=Acidovorax sp. K2F TaxID=2978125 RepID=UPI0021B11A6D|nr:nucleotidyltransferase domain-containing protein [Acidovorax sp. K2F]MCT6721720.1 nucleotidyltransferase domain-containing protein [Acidovorax sp. K2F]
MSLLEGQALGLADFLFTPTLQKVLGATLLHPDRSFTLRELLRLADSGRGSAQKQVERLINSGVLLEDERRGTQRSIRVNTEFIFYAELRSIAHKSFSVVEPLKEALAPFASNISSAFVFGSVAKSTDSAKSDIDLIVIGQVSLLELSEALHEAESKLMRPINFSLYEHSEWTSLVEADNVVAQIANGVTLKVL